MRGAAPARRAGERDRARAGRRAEPLGGLRARPRSRGTYRRPARSRGVRGGGHGGGARDRAALGGAVARAARLSRAGRDLRDQRHGDGPSARRLANDAVGDRRRRRHQRQSLRRRAGRRRLRRRRAARRRRSVRRQQSVRRTRRRDVPSGLFQRRTAAVFGACRQRDRRRRLLGRPARSRFRARDRRRRDAGAAQPRRDPPLAARARPDRRLPPGGRIGGRRSRVRRRLEFRARPSKASASATSWRSSRTRGVAKKPAPIDSSRPPSTSRRRSTSTRRRAARGSAGRRAGASPKGSNGPPPGIARSSPASAARALLERDLDAYGIRA